jgi:hypothetical protein
MLAHVYDARELGPLVLVSASTERGMVSIEL